MNTYGPERTTWIPAAALLALLPLLLAASPAMAGSMTLTTYYPEPRATFDRVRLVPRATLATTECSSEALGSLYYNADENNIYACFDNDSHTGLWAPITGPGGGPWIQDVSNKVIYTKDLTKPVVIGAGPLADFWASDRSFVSFDLRVASGSVRLGGGTNTTAQLDMTTNGTGTFRWLVDDNLGNTLFLQNDASGSFQNILTLDGDTQNVGIGTVPDPNRRLSVQGPSDAAGEPELWVYGKEGLLLLDTRSPGLGNGDTEMCFYPGSSLGSSIGADLQYCLGSSSEQTIFDAKSDDGLTSYGSFLTLESKTGYEGNVGIGVEAASLDPAARLTVLSSGNSSATSALDVRNSDDDTLLFVRDDGAVGIGTPSPIGDLLIISDHASLIVETDAGAALAHANLILQPRNSSTLYGPHATGEDQLNLAASWGGGSGNIIGMVQDRDGQIGVVKPETYDVIAESPTAALDVNGTIHYTGVFQNPSDRRLKKNIHGLDNGLATVLALQPVSFTYQTEEFPDRHFPEGATVGFIAQDVAEVIPDAVTADPDGYYRLGDSQIIPYLVKAVQEFKAKADQQLDALTKRNQILRERAAELKRQLDSWESQ